MSKRFKGYEDGFFPFGPAAGAINGLNEEEIKRKILDVAGSPASVAKWGATTFKRSEGNEGQTYHHNEVTGVTANAIGLQNVGHLRALAIQKELQPQVEAKGKQLIPSFSPGVGEDPLETLSQMAYNFAEIGVPRIEVDYSCANKLTSSGSYEDVLGYDLDAMFAVDEKILFEIGYDISLIRKLPPPIGVYKNLIPETASYFNIISSRSLEDDIVILGLFNSIGYQEVLDEMGEPALSIGEDRLNRGSLSGPAFAEMSVGGLRKYKRELTPAVGTISSIGVNSAEEIYRRVDVEGADLAESVTILWENEKRGKKFGQTITELAQRYHEIREAA